MGKAKIGEWLWRFAAGVMLLAVAWASWIFYQINPTPLVTHAAFEAAAKANAQQSAQGVIAPAAPREAKQAEPREPPIKADRLKLSDSLSAPAAK